MSTYESGVISVVLGIILLIVQMFIDPVKLRPPHYWTARQQRIRMIMGGVFGIVIGMILILLSR